jgi:hypothetical protein
MIKKLIFIVALLAPCLAYGNIPPTASFSDQVVPAATPTCQLGNHGLVRGRPVFSSSTLLAEDGCLMRGAIDNAGSCTAPSDLPWYQNSVTNGHFNIIAVGAGMQPVYSNGGTCPAKTLADVDAYNDQVLARVSQTGQYWLITFYNRFVIPPWGFTDCPDWDDAVSYWTHTAARYANNTNVFYAIMNEPDYQSTCPSGHTPPLPLTTAQIGANEQQIYNIIRSAAPNTPILTWSVSNIGITYFDPAYLNGFSPGIVYGSAGMGVFDFHNYHCCTSDWTTFLGNAQNEHVPLFSTEGPSDNTSLTELDTNNISWVLNQALPESGPPPGVTVFWPDDATPPQTACDIGPPVPSTPAPAQAAGFTARPLSSNYRCGP